MLGTCVPMPVPQALLDLSLTDVVPAIDRVVMYSFSTLAAKPSYPGPGVWLRGAARRLMHLVMQRKATRCCSTPTSAPATTTRHGLDAAPQVRCPASLVLAQEDQMTLPKAAREVARLLKARVHTCRAGTF
jgi:hypothetical protein